MPNSRFHRSTRQRQVILEELVKTESHPTAVELFQKVRGRLPKISLGTVYRNLDILARMGTIAKLAWTDGEARFDGNVGQHDHVRCVTCGKLHDLEHPSGDTGRASETAICGEPAIGDPSSRDFGGFKILGRRLEYFGVCPACQCFSENCS